MRRISLITTARLWRRTPATFLAAALALLLGATSDAQPVVVPVVSTFDQDLEGWTIPPGQGGSLNYAATGGNPGGFANFDFSNTSRTDLEAPLSYRGDWSALDEVGELRFDHKVLKLGSAPIGPPYLPYEVVLEGGTSRARFVSGQTAQTEWATAFVPIEEAAWTVESGSWSALLAHVENLQIRLELVENESVPEDDEEGIDNVMLLGMPVGLDLYYDFEGDAGSLVTDKLTVDGVQHGKLRNQVSLQSANVPYGSQSARFEVPDADTIPPYSSFEVAGSTGLGEDFSIALYVNNSEAPQDHTRLVSSFRGTGPVGADRLLFDYDPSGSVVPGIRAIVNGAIVETPAPPPGLATPGYHHFALTVEGGRVALYLDGEKVASGDVGLGYSNSANLRVGEDPHDGGGAADQQLVGNVDELLVIDRLLDETEILSLTSFPVDSVVTPASGEYAVYYDFEGDLEDGFVADAANHGWSHADADLDDDPANAAFGNGSGRLEFPGPLSFEPPPPYSSFEVVGSTEIGEDFSIALRVDNQESPQDHTRLVSSFRGTGPVGTDRLLLDYDPSGSLVPGIRAIVNGATVETLAPPPALAKPGYHHFALIVDGGLVALYLDGEKVASGNVGLGYSNSSNLLVGEDPHDIGGTADEQLVGNVDELLVIDRVLDEDEILSLTSSPVDSVVTPVSGEYAVYYDFESGLGDRFTLDGSQDAVAHVDAAHDADPTHASLGGGSGRLDFPLPPSPFSRVEIGPVGNLGSAFTMSAAVEVPRAGYTNGAQSRLFSSYTGRGFPVGGLIFDFDPAASIDDIGVRIILPNGTTVQSSATSALNVLHTYTTTYDTGLLRLYLDGAEIASTTISGDVDLGGLPLFIGEDREGVVNENLIGTLDDAFILSHALTPAEVLEVHQQGAAFVLPEPPQPWLVLAGAGLLLALRRRAHLRLVSER